MKIFTDTFFKDIVTYITFKERILIGSGGEYYDHARFQYVDSSGLLMTSYEFKRCLSDI